MEFESICYLLSSACKGCPTTACYIHYKISSSRDRYSEELIFRMAGITKLVNIVILSIHCSVVHLWMWFNSFRSGQKIQFGGL